ncbi:(ABC) transporter [Coemansia nantahalensis]|uniref:(ABC) transporter n=1 Tax=Coemansia nantahalensis TaxID=2789366 RepID=A0ACC1K9S0_9FUNG|nr:(ABC) transporter [Coemansia nantahalensis]
MRCRYTAVALLVPLATWLCPAAAERAEDGSVLSPPTRVAYENKGTRHEIIIERNEHPPKPEEVLLAPLQDVDTAPADDINDRAPESGYGGFNIDGILDLMAGDDDGNVNFGAIGLELANNLANVIDMNEVGSMATTLGMMLSGLGAVNEIQRQGNLAGAEMQNPAAAANLILSSGISALMGQVLSNQMADNDYSHLANLLLEPNGPAGRSGSGAGGMAAGPTRPAAGQDAAGISNLLAGVQASGLDMQQLAGIVNGIMGDGGHLITNAVGQCTIGNKGLSRYLPDGMVPKMTFGCDSHSSSCSAQFWISGKEAFYCNLDQCDIGTWGPKSTASIDCRRMKCSCIPGRFLCGNYGLDISSVLNEVEGPVDIKCHDHGFSDCYIREFIVSKTLASIIGDDAINMECSVGQCMHYSQLPGYRRKSHATHKGNMLIGVGTSLLTVLVVLRLIRLLVRDHDGDGSNSRPADLGAPATPPLPRTGSSSSSKNCEPTDQPKGTDDDGLLANSQKATVAFRNISYTIRTQSPVPATLSAIGIDSAAEKQDASHAASLEVLQGVSGVVHPGEVLAILGASGAGKSTLLDILSRREKCGQVGGKVLINNRDLIGDLTAEEFHRMSGYVDQQDLHVATATVYESVMTSALLRLPRTMTHATKQKRVRQVLTELGLWAVRDSRIGKSGARGISGGEMRRVSIACELVTSPSIIFLDEPTSGLDAYSAYTVMLTLSRLAQRHGRTIICTIHQPRADIFGMFDRLIVLAAGQMCYSGPAAGIAGYLESIGHPVPAGYNVADFSVDLVQHATIAGPHQHRGGGEAPPAAVGVSNTPISDCEKQESSTSSCDGEWSPLLRGSQLSLVGIAGNDSDDKGSRPTPGLHQLLSSFAGSSCHQQLRDELDGISGQDWEPTAFEMVASTGLTPYSRPVTPMQQVRVIFLNLYDLACILYRRLRGQRVTQQLDDKLRPTVYEQFTVLSGRVFRNLYRDPTLMLANYALSLFVGLMCGILFYQLDNSVQGMQNRLGLLMFVLAFYGFGCTTSLLVFAEERLLYLRERANAYYNPLAYFMAKVTFDLVPLRVIPPLLLTLIAYPMIGLAATWPQFIKFFSTLVLFNLTVASQMFFIGLLAEELVVSNFLASIMLLFSLLFGGLILNKESIPAILQSLCRISSFNLAYEALAINELRYAHIEEVRFGLEIQVPSATLVSSFGFDLLAFWPDVAVLCGVMAVSLGLSLLWLTYVIRERR